MIEFQRIRYKNFLAAGNYFTEIELNAEPNTLIIGGNGSGKSTLLDALCFALFNKPFRQVNRSQLVNSTNERDAIVELEFAVNAHDYKIVRGIKPNRFEIFRNGKKLNEDSSAQEQQKTLEAQILKLNYKSFTQIVILGSASFVPFMQLSTAHRREVIEDLLDIKVFSSMKDILKARLKSSRDELKVLELKKQSTADKIVMQQNFIRTIEETSNNDINEKQEQMEDIYKDISRYQKCVEDILVKIENKETELEKYADASDTIRKLESFQTKIHSKRHNSCKDLDFFEENSNCPTCTQEIEESFRLNKTTELKEAISKYENNLSEIKQAISDEESREREFSTLQREITKLNNEVSQTNIRISESNKLRRQIEQEIQAITDKLENRNTEDEKLSNFKQELKSVLQELSDLNTIYDYDTQVNSLLADEGVKRNIIKKYLPLINQQANRYLQMMDFYINFNLDEEFKEKIESPIHENFSYSSFSEGEKMRIDLSLMFSWREIARMKNSVSTNLLIMDEVFDSSLDGFGTDEFMKIIRFVVKDANIFVISHKNELHDKFEKCIEFKRTKGFSRIA